MSEIDELRAENRRLSHAVTVLTHRIEEMRVADDTSTDLISVVMRAKRISRSGAKIIVVLWKAKGPLSASAAALRLGITERNIMVQICGLRSVLGKAEILTQTQIGYRLSQALNDEIETLAASRRERAA
jgi:biotin operon repressor